MDIPAVAARLGVSERFVRRLVSERRIAYLKIGHFVRFEAEQVEQWIEASRVPGGPERRTALEADKPDAARHRRLPPFCGALGGTLAALPRELDDGVGAAPLSLDELAVELLGDGLVELGEEVAVAVERDRDRAWPIRAWIAFGWAPDGDGQGDAGVAEVVEPARHAGSRPGPAEVVGLEARRRQRVAGGVREHEAVGLGRANSRRCGRASIAAVHAEIVIERTPAVVFGGWRIHEPSSSWMSCSVTRTLRPREVDLRTAQADELAPAHARVDGEVDQRPGSARWWASASAIAWSQSRNTISRFGHPGGSDPVARVAEQRSLLDGDLQHPAQRPVVAVDRRRRQAGGRARR